MRLIYFTNAYPYGIGEQWKTNELTVFKKYFDRITVVPFSYLGNEKNVPFIEGIEYTKPLFERSGPVYLFNVLGAVFFSKHTPAFVKELISSKAYRHKPRIVSWLHSSHKAALLLKNKKLKNIFEGSDCNTILYFFWGREASEVIPFLTKDILYKKIVSRFHGYDLYKDRNNGYIPYQDKQVKALNLLLPCSADGREYLLHEYPCLDANAVTIARLGAVSKGISPASNDGVLRIITCSGIVAVKRLHIIVDALSHVTIPVEWTHIGSGNLHAQIKDQSEKLLANKKNVKVKLAGDFPSSAVLDFYINNPCDLFLNVSETEGVPVAIMEALSAGIPVYATNVGGTKEIVDESVGKLLPPNVRPEELAAELEQFYHLPADKKDTLRANSFKRYEQRCNALSNAEELAKILIR